MRVLGVDQVGDVQLQFQLLRGAAAGPACSQGGCPSSLKTRMMTRMMRTVVLLVMVIMVRHPSVVGVVEAVAGRGLLAIGLGHRLRSG